MIENRKAPMKKPLTTPIMEFLSHFSFLSKTAARIPKVRSKKKTPMAPPGDEHQPSPMQNVKPTLKTKMNDIKAEISAILNLPKRAIVGPTIR